MSPEEAAQFTSLPQAAAAIALRLVDDRANREVSSPRALALFRDLAEECRQQLVPVRSATFTSFPHAVTAPRPQA